MNTWHEEKDPVRRNWLLELSLTEQRVSGFEKRLNNSQESSKAREEIEKRLASDRALANELRDKLGLTLEWE